MNMRNAFLLFLILATSASAQKTSHFDPSTGTLVIPHVDIEGVGPYSATLQYSDKKFSISSVLPIPISGTDRNFKTALPSELTNFNFNGTWIAEPGYRNVAYPTRDTFEEGFMSDFTATFTISGTQASLNYISPERISTHPLTFARHLSNVVLTSNRSGRDSDGLWVETQVFILTPVDREHVWALRARMVNNTESNVDIDHSKFADTWLWILKRQ